MISSFDICTGEEIAESGASACAIEPTAYDPLATRLVTVAEAVAEERRQRQVPAALLMSSVDEVLALNL